MGKSTNKICGYLRHPAAALYPMMESHEIEALAEDIKEHGLREPIILVKDEHGTSILDGSNRARACEIAGLNPWFEHYDGPTDIGSLVAFAVSKNEMRRHLDPSARALIAAEVARLPPGRPSKRQTGRTSGLPQAEAGKRLGVSERLVRRAVVVRDKATPKVKEAVMKGRLAVEAAEQVTKLSQAKQDEIAAEALSRKSGTIKSGRVRKLVDQEVKRSVIRKINEQRVPPMPVGLFGVIYGDYPWPYDNSDRHDGSRGHLTYPPMPMDAIIAHAREAAKRAAKDCIVALWTTNLHVVNGNVARVVEAYGATPHSMLTWPKPRMGIGTWGRGQTEHLVIASIGEPTHTLNEISTLLASYKPEHPGEHSSKPAEVAELLVKHCAGPFLELFGRGPRDRWTVWGAEVDKFAAEAA